ncbi:DUF4401 domain-containing protein [Wolbachia endosymbiont of Oedothorax gibbosus]|uniref:DUF4401 domain-containing protein n=1 Tax=Wolbachia endosymbiont of Oedothorax gibbosus TaxID=931100 RepID=UPI002023FFEA|nr:DUF4401 domain-containing protein [Wolbachia endosymbiont of Oedothorax gibbosus]
MSNKYNAAHLLQQLNSKGFAIDNGLSDFIISQQKEKELPIYLRVVIGIGAFIISVCFICFLSAASIIDFANEKGLIIWGMVFVAGAIGLQKIADHNDMIKHSFYMQLSFALMVVGKTIFVYGFGEMLNSCWGITLALLIIVSITYHIYRISIDRFLSSFAVLFSILINIYIIVNKDGGSIDLLLNSFFLFQLASAAILLTHGKIKRDYIPISYAFVFSLCATVLYLDCAELVNSQHKELIYPGFIKMALASGLIALFGWAAGSIEKLKHGPLILASIGAVILGLISNSGILLTIGLMVLGYSKHEKLLIIAGALFMPVFLFLYYYTLNISLMEKSYILIGSGIVLLAGRFYLRNKGWGTSCAQK